MELDRNLVTGSMAMLVMKLLEDGDKYGYQMIEELRQKSEDAFQLKAGTLYPLLHGLEAKGYVTAREKSAENGKTAWETYTEAVGRVLKVGVCFG